MWRNVRIELSSDKMEASCYKGGSTSYWATFAGEGKCCGHLHESGLHLEVLFMYTTDVSVLVHVCYGKFSKGR